MCNEDTCNYYPFQRKVIQVMVRLALNDYPEVRDTARSELNSLLQIFSEARTDVIKSMAEVLIDKNSTVEKVKVSCRIRSI